MPSLPGSGAARPLAQVVLDSNVWIDILVFDDAATRPIHAALRDGRLRAVIDARCLAELACVLDYPQFARRAVDKAAALAHVAALSVMTERPAAPPEGAPALPKCKDRDDQKFLELAHAARVDWLVSKDRALLKLAKRTAREFGFRIAQPGPFAAACLPPAASPEAGAPAAGAPAAHSDIPLTSPIAP